MSIAKKLVASSLARTSYTVIGIVISFFMLPFLVRTLGDKWYGLWTIAASITLYFHLADFGLSAAVTRYVSRYIAEREYEKTNQIINTALGIYSVLAFIIILVAIGFCLIAEKFTSDINDLAIFRTILLIVGVQFAFEFPFKAFTGIIGAYVRYDLLTYCHFFVMVLSTGLTVYFISSGYGVISLAVIGLVCSQLSNLLFYYVTRRLFAEMRLGFEYFRKERVKELFSYSTWAFLIQIVDHMRFTISSIIIAALIAAQAVTHYFIGARLVGLFMELVFRATNILVPVFTRYHAENNYREIADKLLFLTKLNAIAALFGSGLLLILGGPFILRWMGPEYHDSYLVLAILVIGGVCQIIINPANNVLFAMAQHRSLAIVMSVELLINVTLCLVLVRSYGIYGAAVGYALPVFVSSLLVIPVIVCRSIDLPVRTYYKNLLTPVLLTVCYMAIFYVAADAVLIRAEYSNLAISVISAVPLYLAAVFFLLLSRDERQMLKRLISQQDSSDVVQRKSDLLA